MIADCAASFIGSQRAKLLPKSALPATADSTPRSGDQRVRQAATPLPLSGDGDSRNFQRHPNATVKVLPERHGQFA